MEQRTVALEKVTREQGRLMAEMKTDINNLKDRHYWVEGKHVEHKKNVAGHQERG